MPLPLELLATDWHGADVQVKGGQAARRDVLLVLSGARSGRQDPFSFCAKLMLVPPWTELSDIVHHVDPSSQTFVAAGSLPSQWGEQSSLQKLVLLNVSKGGLTGGLPSSWSSQLLMLGQGQGNGFWAEDNQLTGEVQHARSVWTPGQCSPMSTELRLSL